MAGMGATLTNRVGPLPVWAWAGLGTAGLAFVLYRRNQTKSQASQDAANQTGSGLNTNLGATPVSNLVQTASPMPFEMGDTFVNADLSQSQQQGQSQAQDQAQAGAGGSASASSTAATTTSSSAPSTTKSTSTSAVTAPKPPVAPAPAPSKPAPAAAPPVVKQVTQVVCAYPQWCGSLWGIAQHYYGNGALWPTIYNANKGKIGSNPNLIHTGLSLIIPPKPA